MSCRSARSELEGGSLGAASSLMSAALSYYEAASLLDDKDVKLMVGCCHSYSPAAARLEGFLCAVTESGLPLVILCTCIGLLLCCQGRINLAQIVV